VLRLVTLWRDRPSIVGPDWSHVDRPRDQEATPAARGGIGPQIAAALATHRAPATVIDGELSQMRDCRFGPTANRSVAGIMNEFAYLADVYRHSDPSRCLAELGRKLAETPCSPLYGRHVRPGRELEAFLDLIQRPNS
jgi:uncharacterized protein DUF6933